MIQVLIPCFSRQEQLDQTLPLWLKQKGTEFEIILGIGPDITYKPHKRIKTLALDPAGKLSTWGNQLLTAATADVIVMSYCDIAVRNNTQLAQMLEAHKQGAMVTDVYRAGDKTYHGTFLQVLMVERELALKAGGWDPVYDGGYAWEDADFITRMIKQGAYYVQLDTPDDKCPLHIEHRSCRDNADWDVKFRKNRKIYNSRHGLGMLEYQNTGHINGKPVRWGTRHG